VCNRELGREKEVEVVTSTDHKRQSNHNNDTYDKIRKNINNNKNDAINHNTKHIIINNQ
jgi:hypothetical protein